VAFLHDDRPSAGLDRFQAGAIFKVCITNAEFLANMRRFRGLVAAQPPCAPMFPLCRKTATPWPINPLFVALHDKCRVGHERRRAW